MKFKMLFSNRRAIEKIEDFKDTPIRTLPNNNNEKLNR